MLTIVCFDFPFSGPFGPELAKEMRELARSIVEEPGLQWKIWTENPHAREAGGVYLFVDEESAQAYIEKHTARLGRFGVTEVNVKLFQVNGELTRITGGPAVP